MAIFKRRIWWWALLVLMFVGMLIQYQIRAPRRHYSDFHVPYTIGNKLIRNEPIYSFEEGLSYYKYTPFYATLVTPLSILPERAAASVWYILNFLFFIVLFHSSRKIIAGDEPGYDPFWLYALTTWVMFRFILHNMHEGQANVFMLTLLTSGLYFYTKGRRALSAFFIAFAIMTKYTPVLFLPYFLLIGGFALVAMTGVFIAGFYILPALSLGFIRNWQLIHDQLNFLFASSLDPWSIYCHPNQSLLGSAARFFWEKSAYPINIMRLNSTWLFGIFRPGLSFLRGGGDPVV